MSSATLSSFAEDIRLCTIIRADATDILGVYLTHYKIEAYYSLTISKGRNDGPSSEDFI
jgi:hypothetical protein